MVQFKHLKMQRKVYRIDRTGNLKNLTLREESLPDPAPNEVTVNVKAFGLNFADLATVFGFYSATPEGSFIPGLEYAGVIEKTGSDVNGFKEGDKVMGITRFGGYVTKLNIDPQYIVTLPVSWSFEEGASYLVQVLTAYYALFPLGDLREGYNVLIHSAAGGVGLWANRIAKNYNAFTIGTIGSPAKRSLLEKEGYDRIIVRSGNFKEDLKNTLDGRELNLVLDSIGGKILMDGYETLASMGRLVTYGSARYMTPGDKPNMFKMILQYIRRPRIDPQKMPTENKSVMGFNLIYLYDKAELMHQYLNELFAMDLDKPYIGHSFALEELIEAHRLFLTGKTTGKLVIRTEN